MCSARKGEISCGAVFLVGLQVAVVDSGVSRHPDLECNFWRNPAESHDGRDDDGKAGRTDTWYKSGNTR